MPRDRIAELLSIKQRAGKYKRTPSHDDVNVLRATWETKLKGIAPIEELIPVRLVTLLEVFLRSWLEELIDSGAPYVERASKLNLNIKYDFAIAHSLQGGTVTFGELFSHSVSFSDLASICTTFDKILDDDLFAAITNTRDRWEVRQRGEAIGPIVQDIARLKRNIARLLEVRNILVHEIPDAKPYEPDDISVYFDSVSAFMYAMQEHFASLRYPDSPMTQREMNMQAAEDHAAAMEELNRVYALISEEYDSDELATVQALWNAFKEAEATRQAQMHLGGSIRPMLYSLAAASITRVRTKELERWRENTGD